MFSQMSGLPRFRPVRFAIVRFWFKEVLVQSGFDSDRFRFTPVQTGFGSDRFRFGTVPVRNGSVQPVPVRLLCLAYTCKVRPVGALHLLGLHTRLQSDPRGVLPWSTLRGVLPVE